MDVGAHMRYVKCDSSISKVRTPMTKNIYRTTTVLLFALCWNHKNPTYPVMFAMIFDSISIGGKLKWRIKSLRSCWMTGMWNLPIDKMMKTGILMMPPSDLVSSVLSRSSDYTQSPFLSLSICVFLCAILFDQVKLQVSIAMLSNVSVLAIKYFFFLRQFCCHSRFTCFYAIISSTVFFRCKIIRKKNPVDFIEFPYDVVQQQQPQHACAMWFYYFVHDPIWMNQDRQCSCIGTNVTIPVQMCLQQQCLRMVAQLHWRNSCKCMSGDEIRAPLLPHALCADCRNWKINEKQTIL